MNVVCFQVDNGLLSEGYCGLQYLRVGKEFISIR